MPGESPEKDLAEWVELYGWDERLRMHPLRIARYLENQLKLLNRFLVWTFQVQDALAGRSAVQPSAAEGKSADARILKAEGSRADGSASESLTNQSVASSEAGPQP